VIARVIRDTDPKWSRQSGIAGRWSLRSNARIAPQN
jgi:hypothetical protein